MCNICKLPKEIQERIEAKLHANNGILTISDKKELCELFPEYLEKIDALTENECNIHWHFHCSIVADPVIDCDEKQSLTKDINKSEAEILYDLMNKQAATFNALTNKLNKVLIDDESDVNCSIVHPNTLVFYNELASSIRSTVKELRELNVSVNGAKDGAIEGLKALAKALTPEKEDEEKLDLTTDEFD